MESAFDSSYRRKLIVMIVALPVLLAAWGGWQLYRLQGSEMMREDGSDLGPIITEMEGVYRENPSRIVRLPNNATIPVGKFLERLYSMRDDNRHEHLLGLVAFVPLASGTTLCGLLAFVIGGGGLLGIRRSGRRALQSRRALLGSFRGGLRRLPWLIGSVSLLLALSIACGLGFEVANYAKYGFNGTIYPKLIALAVMGIGLLLLGGLRIVRNVVKASRAVFVPEPMLLMGKSVNDSEAPLLWDFVRDVSLKVGATMPDNIVLGLDQGFFVTEHPVEFRDGTRIEGRVLYLPLPYMAYMTRDEVAAVIGHELGHFTGADTEYSLHFSPIYASVVNNLRAVAEISHGSGDFSGFSGRPALMLGEYYLDSFDLAVNHWNRERELAADRMGAAAGGREALALSLLRITVLSPLVGQALQDCWDKGGRIEGGILSRLRSMIVENPLVLPPSFLESVQEHPTDSHPPLSRRLEAVGMSLTPELANHACSSVESGLLRELGIVGATVAEKEIWAAAATVAPGQASEQGVAAFLEGEFLAAAGEEYDEIEATLREQAELGTRTVMLYERWETLVFSWLTISLIAIVGAVALHESRPFSALASLAFGLLCLGLALRMFVRSRRAPLIILSRSGLEIALLDAPIAWESLEDFGLQSIYGNVTLRLFLREGVMPPGSKARRAKYQKKDHSLVLVCQGFRKMKPEDFIAVLQNYYIGAFARNVLTQRESAGN